MYALDKLTTEKIRKGNNSVITCGRVTVLAHCTSSDALSSPANYIYVFVKTDLLETRIKENERTTMVLYCSPEQLDLHTYY